MCLDRSVASPLLPPAPSPPLALGACSSDEATQATPDRAASAAASAALFAGPAGQTATIDMTDIKYSAGALTAKSGEVLEVALTNKGSLDHDVTIKELTGDRALRVEGKEAKVDDGKTAVHAHIKSGSSGTLRLKVHAAGTYEFYCSVAGHKEAGMKGTLTVQWSSCLAHSTRMAHPSGSVSGRRICPPLTRGRTMRGP